MNIRKPNHITDHRRQWRNCLYVYPVVSRRSGGVSIGVNCNFDKSCTFRCAYCQIDRTKARSGPLEVDLPTLAEELDAALDATTTGQLFDEERFSGVPQAQRRLNDIAFSGDGEPTCLPNFDDVVKTANQRLIAHGLRGSVKLIVITNATRLDSPQVVNCLDALEEGPSEVWAKLDAGTQAYFERVSQPTIDITLDDICANILSLAQRRPVIIQTLFCQIDHAPPSDAEIDAYIARLGTLVEGGTIAHLQLHTVARPPAESVIRYLPEADLRQIATRITNALPNLSLTVYPGCDVAPQHP